MIKHRGKNTNINFYFNLKNQLNFFKSSLGTNMCKAAHHSGCVDSLNPRHWRGKCLHHHGGGVCWLFVLLWMDSCCHELIVCKKWDKKNLKMRLMALLFVPHWYAPQLYRGLSSFALAGCIVTSHCIVLVAPLPLDTQPPPPAFHSSLILPGLFLCHFLLQCLHLVLPLVTPMSLINAPAGGCIISRPCPPLSPPLAHHPHPSCPPPPPPPDQRRITHPLPPPPLLLCCLRCRTCSHRCWKLSKSEVGHSAVWFLNTLY
jgi:hypothetical protein